VNGGRWDEKQGEKRRKKEEKERMKYLSDGDGGTPLLARRRRGRPIERYHDNHHIRIEKKRRNVG